jgi:5-methylcytosine-specific restriction endonuclease McrA
MSPYFASGVPVAVERRHKRQARMSAERIAKAAARKRDHGKCRWPHRCGVSGHGLEVAHIVSKSVGGPNATENLILVCREIHQGPVSMHSGDLHIEKLTDAGADGCVAFYRNDEAGRRECVAVERVRGISSTRSLR